MKFYLYLSLALLLYPCGIGAWGFKGHKSINRLAIYSLPDPLFEFYKPYAGYIEKWAVNPDMRRYVVEKEGAKHFIDLDWHTRKISLDSMDLTWREAIDLFTEDSVWENGVVTWNILWEIRKLTEAFLSGDAERIIRVSADLGHYIADAHVPLHTTSNYNGQKTGQHGIHGLWETVLVERYLDSLKLWSDEAEYILDLSDFVWSTVKQSHALLPTVLSTELACTDIIGKDEKYAISYRKSGKTGTPNSSYSFSFTECYGKEMLPIVESRMKSAIHAVASAWYTAWVDAGQPDLSKTNAIMVMSKDTVQKIQRRDQMLGRSEN